MTKILVIDDEEQLCEVLEKILVREGFEVIKARNGIEGMNCFKQVRPDVVITDIFMPNKDGIEVITELLCVNPDIAVIAISGMGLCQLDALDLALLLGAKGVLEKPFTRKQLLEAVEKAFSVRSYEANYLFAPALIMY